MTKKHVPEGVGMKTIIKMNNMGKIIVNINRKKHKSIITIIQEFITRKKTS